MTYSVAHNKDVLTKRLRRFFEEWPDERIPLLRFIKSIDHSSDLYIFGGLIREVCLHGIPPFKSDVDIVVHVRDRDAFDKALLSYEVKRNNFGGCRIKSSRWMIDLWEIQNTWAFSKGYVRPQGVGSLLKTTFFDWDAALYDLQGSRLYCEDDYFSKISAGLVDINLRNNPNEQGVFVRALRLLVKEHARTGCELSHFIVANYNSMSNADILHYESTNFNSRLLTESLVQSMRDRAQRWVGQHSFSWLPDPQLSLFSDEDNEYFNSSLLVKN